MSKRTILSATALLGTGFLAGWLVGTPGADAPPPAEDSPPTSVETARSDASESPMPAAPKPKEGQRVRITRTPSPSPGKRGTHPRTGTGRQNPPWCEE